MKATESEWVCIDFGTCNTAAAIGIDGVPHVVSYSNQQYFPTVACVLEDGSIEVCHDAESFRKTHPETFKQEFKLDIADEVEINSATYTDIVANILMFIKGCAEIENNGKPIENVVLTVPALYTENDARKNVMTTAARRAGFKQIELLPEPTAAALHYEYITGNAVSGISLIYDLGGGTFDPILLEMSKTQSEVLGKDSGVKCGGHFFDRAIYNHIKSFFADSNPLSRGNRLEDYEACRRMKESLSVLPQATQVFSNGERYTLTRDDFESLIQPLIDLTLKSCDNIIFTADRQWSDVRRILLVGGSTAIPLVASMLKKHLVSHSASDVMIIRNVRGAKGEYNNRFATCLGGISGKIIPPPPPPEKPAEILVNDKACQLKMGENRFGRSEEMDFTFSDPTLSRHHFTITVTRSPNGKLTYFIETKSNTRSTIINGMEALDLRFAPVSRISAELLDGYTITAGHTKFVFKKNQ